MGERMLYSSVEQPLDSSKHGAGHKPIAYTKSSFLGQISFTLIDLETETAIKHYQYSYKINTLLTCN
jgi:hypothetical protein